MSAESALEFPEIQRIRPLSESPEGLQPPGEGVVEGSAEGQGPSGVGQSGKSRFSNAALRVMSKIALERKQKQSEDKDDQTRKEDKLPEIVTSDHGPARKSTATFEDLVHSRSKFASLVRLAGFRRNNALLAARLAKRDRENSQSDLDEVENTEPPTKPCFAATLSPEAQYAMLKGYEDVLIQHIRNADCLEHKRALCRVKTPHRKVVALHLSEAEAPVMAGRSGIGEDVQSIVLGSQSSSLSERNLHRYVLNREHSKKNLLPEIRREDHRSPVSRKYSKLDLSFPHVSKDKQLRLTCRFQRAMDILDTLKTSRGLPVTSSRYKTHPLRPIETYNKWSKTWAKEFQFQYARPGSEQTGDKIPSR